MASKSTTSTSTAKTRLMEYLEAPLVPLPPTIQLPLFCSPIYAVQWKKQVGDPDFKSTSHGLFEEPQGSENKNNNRVVDLREGEPEDFSIPLETILTRIMPDCKYGGTRVTNFAFWKHEWEKHGQRFGVTLEEYFGAIHYLYEHLSPDDAAMGLHPGVPLSVQDIQSSIKRNFGAKPALLGRVKGATRGVKRARGVKPAQGVKQLELEEFHYRITDGLAFTDMHLRDHSGDIKSVHDRIIIPR